MPGRQTRKRDPFQRIHSWDDGYDYLSNTTPSPGSRNNNTPYFSTPPTGANRSYYEPDREPPRRSKSQRNPPPEPYNPRRAYPSPPSDYSDSPRDRDRRRNRSPPPYRERESRSPSPPPRRRDCDRDHRARRPSLETYPTAPPPHRPNNRPPRSPSPPRHRDRDSRRDASGPARSARYRSPSPPRKPPRPSAGDAPRPGLSRSKTTGAAAAAFAKERFNNLNPQWKAAAMAAIQAGGMAALQARKQPGGWNGEKGAKIATAALGAAAMGALKKDEKSGDGRKGDGKRSSGGGRKNSGVDAIGGALGGFLADQFAKREGKRR